MASSVDVAAFRAAGHSVSSTASHFGISDRAVYKACQAQAARLRRGVARVALPSSTRLIAAGGSVFGGLADDVARDNTFWLCPVTHELLPVVPGSRRLSWMQERHDVYARLRSASGAPVEIALPESACVVTPEPEAFIALESVIAPIEPAALPANLPVVALHNLARVNVDAPGVDWSWLSSWIIEYWRVPLAVVVAVLLVALSF